MLLVHILMTGGGEGGGGHCLLSIFHVSLLGKHTISKKHSSAREPSLEDLLFENDFGDQVLGTPFKQVVHRQGAITAQNGKS